MPTVAYFQQVSERVGVPRNVLHNYISGRVIQRFVPCKGWICKYKDDPTPWPVVVPTKYDRRGCKILARCIHTNKVLVCSGGTEASNMTKVDTAMVQVLCRSTPIRPWKGWMFQYFPTEDTSISVWPDYRDDVRQLLEKMDRKCNPIKATFTATGVTSLYLGIKYWVRENDIPNDPATVCRGFKSGRKDWFGWKLESFNPYKELTYVKLPIPAN